MATKAGSGTGKTSSKTSAARKRAPSKPLIIDVEADASPASEQPAAVGAASAGLDEATARAAGLSASGPAAQPASREASSPAQTSTSADDAAPETREPSETASSSPAFVLAAAGFVGALAALALMFLAQLMGFVSVPNGQLDEQRAALLVLEERVDTRLSALEAVEPAQAAPDLASIEAELADLRDEIASLSAQPASDAAPVDIDALIAAALTPLEERIGAIEAVIQFPALPLDGAPDEAPADAVPNDPLPVVEREELTELRDLIAAASRDIMALRSQIGSVQVEIDALSNAENPAIAEISALDARLSELSTDVAGRLEALSARVSQLGDGMAVMGDELNAFEQAPIAVAPDQLARLGLALDGLADARDRGLNLSDAVSAALAASAFDPDLSGALAPLSSLSVDAGLDGAGLLARYDNAVSAMRAAAAGSTPEDADDVGAGLLGALGERARQMVTIRGPGDTASDAPGTVSGQIDQLGSVIASGQYDVALTAFDGLPDSVKAAGVDVRDALSARLSLDNALTQARSGLLAALASSNQ